ncbi:unnamed protein product [Timema podura]|uniref:LRRCT domain-containing protein n=1 Tax=Timema podura TaxID=61482 RepID=A0ABN7NCQ0_TIMPD|nr:unnamed protein product [Timema podura]
MDEKGGLIACVASDVIKTSECGYCKCKSVQESPITASPTTETIVHVNCSGVTSGSGQIRVPNLTEYLKSNSLSSGELWIEFNGNGIRNISNLKLPNVLNISTNSLEFFQIKRLPKLRILDISNNSLTSVPDGITVDELASLEEIYLDFNPIKNISFPTTGRPFEKLNVMSFRNNPVLTVLNAGVFSGLFKNVDTLRLSNNPTLSKIHEEAFKGVKINKELRWQLSRYAVPFGRKRNLKTIVVLPIEIRAPTSPSSEIGYYMFVVLNYVTIGIDLSSNAFTSVSQTLLDWKTLQTVDLQDNPWHCECSLQWMLDIVVAKLYKVDQQLLYNLKCASPAIVSEKRMVHFYNWTKPAFCSGFEQLRMNPGQSDPTSSSWLGTSNAAIIVVCSLLGVLVLLVALGIFLQRKMSARRRIKNRRENGAAEPETAVARYRLSPVTSLDWKDKMLHHRVLPPIQDRTEQDRTGPLSSIDVIYKVKETVKLTFLKFHFPVGCRHEARQTKATHPTPLPTPLSGYQAVFLVHYAIESHEFLVYKGSQSFVSLRDLRRRGKSKAVYNSWATEPFVPKAHSLVGPRSLARRTITFNIPADGYEFVPN